MFGIPKNVHDIKPLTDAERYHVPVPSIRPADPIPPPSFDNPIQYFDIPETNLRARVYFPSVYDADLNRQPWVVVRARQYKQNWAIRSFVDGDKKHLHYTKLGAVGYHPTHREGPKFNKESGTWSFEEVPGQLRMAPNVPYMVTELTAGARAKPDEWRRTQPSSAMEDTTATTTTSSSLPRSTHSSDPQQIPDTPQVSDSGSTPLDFNSAFLTPTPSTGPDLSDPDAELSEKSETVAYWLNEAGIGSMENGHEALDILSRMRELLQGQEEDEEAGVEGVPGIWELGYQRNNRSVLAKGTPTGSFSMASTKSEGKGLGLGVPATQTHSTLNDTVRAELNQCIGRLVPWILKHCLQREEFKDMEFRGIMNNVPGVGHHQNRFLTSLQLNLSYIWDNLQTAIGELQGTIHLDSGDHLVAWTIFILFFDSPDKTRTLLSYTSHEL